MEEEVGEGGALYARGLKHQFKKYQKKRFMITSRVLARIKDDTFYKKAFMKSHEPTFISCQSIISLAKSFSITYKSASASEKTYVRKVDGQEIPSFNHTF